MAVLDFDARHLTRGEALRSSTFQASGRPPRRPRQESQVPPAPHGPPGPTAHRGRPAAQARAEAKDDSVLVSEFLSTGAHEPFHRLVERYKDRVFRLVASILGPAGSLEAEDVTQEVFLQIYNKLFRFRSGSSFSTWLYRVAYTRAIDYRRKARLRFPHLGDDVLSLLPNAEKDGDPLAGAQAGEERRRVHRSVESLAEPYRTVIYLFYWMDCSVDEIAEYLATKPGTVKSYLFRARQRLSRRLGCEVVP